MCIRDRSQGLNRRQAKQQQQARLQPQQQQPRMQRRMPQPQMMQAKASVPGSTPGTFDNNTRGARPMQIQTSGAKSMSKFGTSSPKRHGALVSPPATSPGGPVNDSLDSLDELFSGSSISISQEDELSLIHISEPTRLLSISYAVFCLKKKHKN
eukprot:TRINITY_DN28762_c0_g1_i1.p1 TRINITY_DN28762_c0_g1~~TRINITY_DN28762_c0_g1_i1.p1  ORF type:complete len:154 (+),score=35.79 TRINITY_DN28762_c0_g1_i1:130-591(+)